VIEVRQEAADRREENDLPINVVRQEQGEESHGDDETKQQMVDGLHEQRPVKLMRGGLLKTCDSKHILRKWREWLTATAVFTFTGARASPLSTRN
jgi:hypothetical protein